MFEKTWNVMISAKNSSRIANCGGSNFWWCERSFRTKICNGVNGYCFLILIIYRKDLDYINRTILFFCSNYIIKVNALIVKTESHMWLCLSRWLKILDAARRKKSGEKKLSNNCVFFFLVQIIVSFFYTAFHLIYLVNNKI